MGHLASVSVRWAGKQTSPNSRGRKQQVSFLSLTCSPHLCVRGLATQPRVGLAPGPRGAPPVSQGPGRGKAIDLNRSSAHTATSPQPQCLGGHVVTAPKMS